MTISYNRHDQDRGIAGQKPVSGSPQEWIWVRQPQSLICLGTTASRQSVTNIKNIAIIQLLTNPNKQSAT